MLRQQPALKAAATSYMYNLIWKSFAIEQGHVKEDQTQGREKKLRRKDRERIDVFETLQLCSTKLPWFERRKNGCVAKRTDLEKVDDLDHIAIEN